VTPPLKLLYRVLIFKRERKVKKSAGINILVCFCFLWHCCSDYGDLILCGGAAKFSVKKVFGQKRKKMKGQTSTSFTLELVYW